MSKKKSEMVAVMLERRHVEDIARWKDNDPAIKATITACKRALRPGPPTSGVMHWLRDHGKHGLGEYAGAAAWIEYVREHGWEAGE